VTELVQVRRNPAARASSVEDPNEWTITEDGFRFGKGDLVFNYYDCEWVVVDEDPTETHGGWFRTRRPNPVRVGHEQSDRGPLLNSIRVSANLRPWADAEKYPKPELD
jgi:hypothetical protein